MQGSTLDIIMLTSKVIPHAVSVNGEPLSVTLVQHKPTSGERDMFNGVRLTLT